MHPPIGARRVLVRMRGSWIDLWFMNPFFAVIVLTLVPACFVMAGEVRVWTSRDGRQLSGEFVRASSKAVTIRTEDGRNVDISADLLADEDLIHATKLATRAKAAEDAAKMEDGRGKQSGKFLKGPLTYGLSGGSGKWPDDRKNRIVASMDAAVAFFNEHGRFEKHVTANNSPGTPTADANLDGWINWGGSISRRVALHEISHTLGVGTHPQWMANIKDGKWTGKHALKQLREFDGKDAVLHADRMHFWPYGLNFDNESSPTSDVRFVKMVEALRKDMGMK